jgi:biotin transport system substrate-specific component
MKLQIKQMVFAALFAALMIVGAYIKIPVGPVPIVLTNLFVLLAGLMLGPGWGLVSVGLYLLLGIVGVPVFSGGGGPAYFAGPTGGYLLGYLPAVLAAGFIGRRGGRKYFTTAAAVIAAFALIYAAGVPWLKRVLDMTWRQAAAAGLLPFLLGDALKGGAAYALRITLHRTMPEFLPG